MAGVRVLHCIHSLSGGGAERQLNLLARHSNGMGVEHAVFCVSLAGLAPAAIAMRVFQSSSTSKWNWRLWRDLARTIREYEPQIVHVWLPASMTIPALWLARRFRKRAVFSFRTQMVFHRPLSIPEWVTALLCSNRVVSCTPVASCAWPFRLLYRIKRGLYIPNSVAGDDAVQKFSYELAPGQPAKVLFVGRLAVEKNLSCLLRALSMLQEIPWQLTVCGRGAGEVRLRSLAQTLGIERRVQWLGFRSDVAQIMAAQDLLVLPSWREGSPNVALEAMAAGLPCILSRIPANVALFADAKAALLFDPASPVELAAALTQLIADPQLRIDLARRASVLVSAFKPEETARSYALFYRHLSSAAP